MPVVQLVMEATLSHRQRKLVAATQGAAGALSAREHRRVVVSSAHCCLLRWQLCPLAAASYVSCIVCAGALQQKWMRRFFCLWLQWAMSHQQEQDP
mmetsp:Transcript_17367/g.33919  ORF Transcript_17367/g.33919 Transcript_17367/m.33919 type:complete len:96 (+) Transcript_17367:420-707(+)